MATADVGMPAPDFKLAATGKQEIALTQYRGSKHVILAFYPLDWSPT